MNIKVSSFGLSQFILNLYFFIVSCIIVFSNSNLPWSIFLIIALFRFFIFGCIDHVFQKKLYYDKGKLKLRYGYFVTEINVNNCRIENAQISSYSRTTAAYGVLLYKNYKKILKLNLTFKNSIILYGSFNREEIDDLIKKISYKFNILEI